MQNHMFMNPIIIMTESSKYYKEHFTLDILYIFVY